MTFMSKLLMAAAIALPVAGFASTAAASEDSDAPAWTTPIRWDDNYNDIALPRHVIIAKLQQSYAGVHDVALNGDFYTARAEDNNGRDVGLTADAYTGRIVQVNDVRERGDWNSGWSHWDGGHRDSVPSSDNGY